MKTTMTQAAADLRARTAEAKAKHERMLSEYAAGGQTWDRWHDVDEARRAYLALADARA